MAYRRLPATQPEAHATAGDTAGAAPATAGYRSSVPDRPRPSIRGQKATLPHKPCAVCGRPMSWRRSWAKNWDDVRYCSKACRRRRREAGDSTRDD